MNTVVLSYYYPPLRAPRATQVERLVRHSRLPIRVLCSAEGAEPCRPQVDIQVFPDRSPRWWRLAKHLLYLPDGLRPWANHLARKAETDGLVGRDDVLVTFGQPMSDHLAGLYLKRRIGMPWIAHFSDPWSDNPFHLPIPFARGVLARMERQVLAEADRVLFTSEETVELVMRKYPTAWRERVSVLPHAFQPELYGDGKRVPGNDGHLTVRYLGNFYRQRNPRRLAEALKYLQTTQPSVLSGVRFELIGRWLGKTHWSPAEYGLREGLLTLMPSVSYQESLHLMRDADILLTIDAPFENSVFFPSKLVDYLGAGRPLLAMTPPGASARIVEAAGGWVIDPGEPHAAAEGLARALREYRAGVLRPSGKDARFIYDARNVALEFDRMVGKMMGCPSRDTLDIHP